MSQLPSANVENYKGVVIDDKRALIFYKYHPIGNTVLEKLRIFKNCWI